MTGHKPSISTFNNPRAQATFRIERVRLKLEGFCCTVEHIHGASNPSDYLSPNSISVTEDLRQTKDLKAYVNYIFQSLIYLWKLKVTMVHLSIVATLTNTQNI